MNRAIFGEEDTIFVLVFDLWTLLSEVTLDIHIVYLLPV